MSADPHPGWLADHNRLYRIMNEHAPMADALMNDLTDFLADIEARIETTAATEPMGVIAKLVYGLQVSAEKFEPSLDLITVVLAEAQSVAGIGHSGMIAPQRERAA